MAVVYSVLAGGVVGVLNGLLITRLRVIPFIATLGTLGMARGVAKWIAGQQTMNVPPTWVNELAVTFPAAQWLISRPASGSASRWPSWRRSCCATPSLAGGCLPSGPTKRRPGRAASPSIA